MFSIIVASVIGRLSTEPRQAHLILFFDKRDSATPYVVTDKITIVIKAASCVSNFNINITPSASSKKG